jgi:hypothetical protein
MGAMKTTLEIPEALFRRVKSKAAERGQSLNDFVNEALHEKLAPRRSTGLRGDPEWMQGFGQLRRLHEETERIQARIDEAFEVVEPEDRA